jgi:hypothetical protein
MEDEKPEAKTSLGVFLAPAGAVRPLTVGPGDPGPGDEWHVPEAQLPGATTATALHTEPPQPAQDQPLRPDEVSGPPSNKNRS